MAEGINTENKISRIEKLRKIQFLNTYVKNPSIQKARIIAATLNTDSGNIFFFWINKDSRYGCFVNPKPIQNEPRTDIKQNGSGHAKNSI